jgi:hypothetical protein
LVEEHTQLLSERVQLEAELLVQIGNRGESDVPFLRRNCIHDSWHMLRTSPPRCLAARWTSATDAHYLGAGVDHTRYEVAEMKS